MGQVRVHVVFSRVGQSIYELVNEGLNDTGWDKVLGVFFMDFPVPAHFMTVRVQILSQAFGTRHEDGGGKIY